MKKILLLVLTIIMVGQTFAQRKTTSVKGYYRKNGTYVSPHTRHYNAGNGSYSSSSNSTNSTSQKEEDNIPLTTLSIASVEKSDYTKSKYGKSVKITSTTLIVDEKESANIENDTLKSKPIPQINGIVIYVSVLRYNGKTIDICPVTRDYSGDWDFNKVQHRFTKNSISAEEALQLISDYGWTISGEELKKDFSYDYISSKGFPKYLTKTVEAMKLK